MSAKRATARVHFGIALDHSFRAHTKPRSGVNSANTFKIARLHVVTGNP